MPRVKKLMGEVDEQLRGQRGQGPGQVALGVDEFLGGRVQVEQEERHGDAEDAIAQGGQALDVLAGEVVVGLGHGLSPGEGWGDLSGTPVGGAGDWAGRGSPLIRHGFGGCAARFAQFLCQQEVKEFFSVFYFVT